MTNGEVAPHVFLAPTPPLTALGLRWSQVTTAVFRKYTEPCFVRARFGQSGIHLFPINPLSYTVSSKYLRRQPFAVTDVPSWLFPSIFVAVTTTILRPLPF